MYRPVKFFFYRVSHDQELCPSHSRGGPLLSTLPNTRLSKTTGVEAPGNLNNRGVLCSDAAGDLRVNLWPNSRRNCSPRRRESAQFGITIANPVATGLYDAGQDSIGSLRRRVGFNQDPCCPARCTGVVYGGRNAAGRAFRPTAPEQE